MTDPIRRSHPSLQRRTWQKTPGLVALLFMSLASACSTPDEPTLGQSCLSLSSAVANGSWESPAPTDLSPWKDLAVPPLSVEDALDRFRIEEGFRIEPVAQEPMIVDPVAMDIDADGRLWVVNMPSYNHDPREILETTGERTPEREQMLRDQLAEAPAGEVVILEDTNGDGGMDRRSVFLDGIMLPRAIRVFPDGVLLAEPPHLWWIEDTNGDGKGDQKTEISDQFTTPRSPQSGPSALHYGMDNWIHSAHFPSIRRVNGEWIERPFEPLGQWELRHDNWGRLYSSSNSWPLQAHLSPHGYSGQHPGVDLQAGFNERVAPNGPVWPAHAPGVNRGYRTGVVTREDGTLMIGAGISSTEIYRGGQFGEAYEGNIFTPVSAGNLVTRLVSDSQPGRLDIEARFAWEDRDFLTSTDERFRPVNIYNAPDGSLYVVDMYRGLFDYILWVTDFLREHSLERDLEQPTAITGRIWRIRPSEGTLPDVPRLSEWTPSAAVELLNDPRGAVRDRVQQVLASCSPASAVEPLVELTRNLSAESWSRLQALWTLEGMDREQVPQKRLTALALDRLDDPHPEIRTAAIRMLEPALEKGITDVEQTLRILPDRENFSEREALQLAASLSASRDPQTVATLASLLDRHPEDSRVREMVRNSSAGREAALRGELARRWSSNGQPPSVFQQEILAWLEEQADSAFVAEQIEPEIPDHLDGAGQDLYRRGAPLYSVCSSCHGPNGGGIDGVGARLDGSAWVQGAPESLIRILLHGMDGAAAERDETIPNDMPSHGFLSNNDLAALLTWLRNSWNNQARPITPEQVQEIRELDAGRTGIWSPDELRAAETP
ncbi:MAG: c-type cytochrome [Balneolaceae bacterium]